MMVIFIDLHRYTCKKSIPSGKDIVAIKTNEADLSLDSLFICTNSGKRGQIEGN